jgi:hypothetical protein
MAWAWESGAVQIIRWLAIECCVVAGLQVGHGLPRSLAWWSAIMNVMNGALISAHDRAVLCCWPFVKAAAVLHLIAGLSLLFRLRWAWSLTICWSIVGMAVSAVWIIAVGWASLAIAEFVGAAVTFTLVLVPPVRLVIRSAMRTENSLN